MASRIPYSIGFEKLRAELHQWKVENTSRCSESPCGYPLQLMGRQSADRAQIGEHRILCRKSNCHYQLPRLLRLRDLKQTATIKRLENTREERYHVAIQSR